MTRRMLLAALGAISAAAAFLATPLQAQELKKIRIGWQPTTTVEAQIAHAMAKTNILELNGLQGEMIMFSFGPAVNEALVGGSIDVGFIGDMPSVSLAVANAPTTVVGRQSVFRGSILATPKSGINSLADLKGKKLYGPVGSSIYLAAVSMLEKAGLKPGKDVEMVHMGFADLSDAIKSGKVDAAAKAAEKAVEGPENKELRKAAEHAASSCAQLREQEQALASSLSALGEQLRAAS